MTTGEILKYKTDLCDQYVQLASEPCAQITTPGLKALLQGTVKEAFSDGFDAGVMFAEGRAVTFSKLKNDTHTGKT